MFSKCSFRHFAAQVQAVLSFPRTDQVPGGLAFPCLDKHEFKEPPALFKASLLQPVEAKSRGLSSNVHGRNKATNLAGTVP